MQIVRTFFNGLHFGLVVLAKILLVAMVLIISVNVTLRYVFNSGLAWSEEIALVLVVWFTFIAMAMGVKQKLHININILPARIPRLLDFTVKRLASLLVCIVGIIMLVYGTILTKFTMQSILPATGIPAGVMYIIMPISSIPILYDSFSDLVGFDKKDGYLDQKLGGKGA